MRREHRRRGAARRARAAPGVGVQTVGVEHHRHVAPRARARARTRRAPSLRPSPGPSASAPPRSIASSTCATAVGVERAVALGQPAGHQLGRRRAEASTSCSDARHAARSRSPRRRASRARGHARRARQAARAAGDDHVPGGELGRRRAASRQRARASDCRSGRSSRRTARRAECRCRRRRTSPACALPGRIHSPGLAAWKVTVTAARTALRRRPRRSTRRRRWARRRRRRAPATSLSAAIAVATAPRGSPAKPVPSSASTSHAPARASRRRGAVVQAPSSARARRRAGARGSRARRRRTRPAAADADDRHLAAGLAQQARGDQPVAAVVALAAHDRDRAVGREPLDRARDGRAGALHQLEAGDALLARSPSGRRAHRLGVGQRRQPVGQRVHDSDARWSRAAALAARRREPAGGYSTVTVLARLRGWSTFSPRLRAIA